MNFKVSPSTKKLARCKVRKGDGDTTPAYSFLVYRMMVINNHRMILIGKREELRRYVIQIMQLFFVKLR